MPSNQVELKFADGDYLFALRLPEILELQRVCEAEILRIYGRLLKGWYSTPEGLEFGVAGEGAASILDIYETIRLGLIGGGRGIVNNAEVPVSAIRARQLVETYCHAAPVVESWKIAKAVIFATIEGYEETQKKSPSPGTERRPRASTKRKSSQTAQ